MFTFRNICAVHLCYSVINSCKITFQASSIQPNVKSFLYSLNKQNYKRFTHSLPNKEIILHSAWLVSPKHLIIHWNQIGSFADLIFLTTRCRGPQHTLGLDIFYDYPIRPTMNPEWLVTTKKNCLITLVNLLFIIKGCQSSNNL